MMKKTIAFLLAVLIALSVAACSDGKESGQSGEAGVRIWSAYALEKIMRDDVYENTAPASLVYEMAKNEVEGAQFIITPEEGCKVDAFNVTVSDLKNSKGKSIPREDVNIYLQKYINVTNKMSTDPAAHAGFTPDALLPFAKAVEYGENRVEGVNQAVYMTVETHTDTLPGVYTGEVNVEISGKIYPVPVSVTVWDFAISEETHIQSLFSIWQQELIYGELDSSNEMYALYYEYLAEHRLSAGPLISMFWNNFTVDEYVEAVKKADADPRISTYSIPYRTAYGQDMDYDYVKSVVKKIVLASEKDGELLDKAVYYFGALIDEPQYTGTFELAHRIFVGIDQMEESIITELAEEGYFDDYSPETAEIIKEKIRKIPNILTTSYTLTETQEVTEFEFGECTYCPLFNELHGYNNVAGEENLSLYTRLKEVNGSLWWYGCNGPDYPYPSYHIDSPLLGARILGTMQYDYNIDGNLYWCVNSYSQSNTINNGDVVRASDPYEDAARNSPTWPTNGEGFLLYPGIDYGIKGPVGSIRLEAIRDGNEDYEYYYLLNQLTEGLSEYYDMEITTEGMVSNLYDRLYNGVQYAPDVENFYAVKRELAQIIERCGQDNKLVVNGIKYSGENATIEFLVSSDYAVKVNGNGITGTKQGDGNKYTYTIKMDKPSNAFEIEIEKDGKTSEVTVQAGGKTAVLSDFNEQSDLALLTPNDQKVSLSFNSLEEYAVSGGSAKAVIESKFDPDDPFATLLYNPQLSIDVKKNNLDLTKMNTLVFSIYNASGTDIDLRVRFDAGGVMYTAQEIVLKDGKWTDVRLENIYLTNWSSLSRTKYILLEFNNTVNNANEQAMPLQTVYIDDMIYTEKNG